METTHARARTASVRGCHPGSQEEIGRTGRSQTPSENWGADDGARFFKKSLGTLGLSERKQMMQSIPSTFSVRRQCALLGLSRSLLYYQPKENSADTGLSNEIYELWLESPFYGYRRIHAQLVRNGHAVNVKRVKRLMQEMKLVGMAPGSKTTKREPKDPTWPCLLEGMKIQRSNQVWATDITYLRLPKGFIYLVDLIELYSRYIVAYQVPVTLDAEFCVRMAQEAFATRQPEIFHSDQGSQFTCVQVTLLLLERKIKGSMTGK